MYIRYWMHIVETRKVDKTRSRLRCNYQVNIYFEYYA